MKPALSASWTNGKDDGPVLNIALNGLSTSTAIPVATTAMSGVINTTTQSCVGHKFFTSAFSVGALATITDENKGIYMAPTGALALSGHLPTIYFKHDSTSQPNVFLRSVVNAIMVQPRLLIGASATTAV